ncbi:restriction endonuclease subunit R [Romeria aff. gracilis LEGE 07310]|uniref:Restriction endonuclease subunit R n=1 Tax=Vasconcelosia minhoensis LEGE 07310 TaxID=915328 RepID=A0A8J7AYL0_9CYAN|nr:restriction endonuclease subunit R [Romeria gracilis]MBE9078672.1 restriction endonuclease subunit R [Romeria aff. gracilis LEGE 07310]
MAQTVSVDQVTLYDLEQRFGLRQVESGGFFPEWQAELPKLTDAEQQRLARVEAAVANLEHRSVLENTVKLAVIAPLLDLAGLFLPPFYVTTEKTVDIEAADNSLTVRGRLDILVLQDRLWVMVIESKRAEFSLKVGIPQVLSYMLAAPERRQPLYGLVTHGTDFIFLKLDHAGPNYARSHQFVLGQNAGLARVLQIMKHLAAAISPIEG